MKICNGCKNEIEKYSEFPGQLCLECYRVTPEANRPITARELAQMWGAK
jgi:hypothetical protein